jgi:LysM repeat protein
VNTLKPLLIVAVLAGIGYGVYVRINSGGGAPPPGAPKDWEAPPEVQLGNASTPGGIPPVPSDLGAADGMAPPFGSPAAPVSVAPNAHEAPPFNPAAAPPAAPPLGVEAGTTSPPFDQSATMVPPVAEQSFGNPPPSAIGLSAQPGAADTSAADRYQTPDGSMPDRYATPDPSVPDRYRTPDGAPPVGTDALPNDNGASPQQAGPNETFVEVMDSAKRDLEAGQLAGGLAKLSAWHDDPRLAPAEQQQLNQLLDQVAGTVIYSTQHLLEPPYEVQPRERLEDIAQRYGVPWELLAKINGIEDPNNLRAGERLKVIRGPFNAIVNLQKRELTLMLPDGMYAGRFPIGIGQEQPPREGTYSVSDKVVNPVYHGRAKVAAAGEAGNPYGTRWIGLGSDLGIHGTEQPENIGRTDLPGSISLSPRDIEDVFDILEAGSKVTIRR